MSLLGEPVPGSGIHVVSFDAGGSPAGVKTLMGEAIAAEGNQDTFVTKICR